MGGGARSAPFCMLMSLKKTGARSARARTRGQLTSLIIFSWQELLDENAALAFRHKNSMSESQSHLAEKLEFNYILLAGAAG